MRVFSKKYYKSHVTIVGAHVSPSDQPYVVGDGIWRPMYMDLLTKEDGDVVSRFINSDVMPLPSHTFTITPAATLYNRTKPLYFRVTYREYAWNGTTFAATDNYADETFELGVIKITKDSEITSGDFKYRIDTQKKTAELLAPTKKSITSITVPATIKVKGKSYKVTEISPNACKGLKKLKKLKTGKNVKIIGDGAFSGCTALTESEIGANVQIIGKGAFNGCKKQKAVKFKGSKVKTIGQNAFKGNAAKVTFKCPTKKLKAYTILIKAAGAPKKAKYTK